MPSAIDGALCLRVVGKDLLVAAGTRRRVGHRDQTPARRLASVSSRNTLDLAIEADLVGFALGHVVEEDFALGIAAGPSVNL